MIRVLCLLPLWMVSLFPRSHPRQVMQGLLFVLGRIPMQSWNLKGVYRWRTSCYWYRVVGCGKLRFYTAATSAWKWLLQRDLNKICGETAALASELSLVSNWLHSMLGLPFHTAFSSSRPNQQCSGCLANPKYEAGLQIALLNYSKDIFLAGKMLIWRQIIDLLPACPFPEEGG